MFNQNLQQFLAAEPHHAMADVEQGDMPLSSSMMPGVGGPQDMSYDAWNAAQEQVRKPLGEAVPAHERSEGNLRLLVSKHKRLFGGADMIGTGDAFEDDPAYDPRDQYSERNRLLRRSFIGTLYTTPQGRTYKIVQSDALSSATHDYNYTGVNVNNKDDVQSFMRFDIEGKREPTAEMEFSIGEIEPMPSTVPVLNVN